jgi:hypothetical protein
MIKQLHIENFRSIKKADLPLGKFTVITGGNNSGKSSIIYALLTLKNLVNNPNQSLDNFFVYGGLNLGGFSQTVFQKKGDLFVKLGIDTEWHGFFHPEFEVNLNPAKSTVKLTLPDIKELFLQISFPYSLNNSIENTIKFNESPNIDINWNGFSAIIGTSSFSPGIEERSQAIAKEISIPYEILNHTDLIPVRRVLQNRFMVLYRSKARSLTRMKLPHFWLLTVNWKAKSHTTWSKSLTAFSVCVLHQARLIFTCKPVIKTMLSWQIS